MVLMIINTPIVIKGSFDSIISFLSRSHSLRYYPRTEVNVSVAVTKLPRPPEVPFDMILST